MTTDTNQGALRSRDVRRRSDRAAASIDAADFVHRTTAAGVFERMAPMQLEVRHILELGCATGKCSRRLAKQFRRARVVSLDLSIGMLKAAKSRRGRFSGIREVQADASQLPFADATIDLVYANLLLPWIDDLPACFADVARVLRKDGLFAFSSLGPDSLAALRDAWGKVDEFQHVNRFHDMHDIGDALMQNGLRDPVLDVDYLTVTYNKLSSLFDDLTAAGARNSLLHRASSLTGKNAFEAMKDCLHSQIKDGALQLPLEIVYGHAWSGGPRPDAGEFRLDVEQIGRRR